MKRIDLIRHLEQNGVYLLREGAKHSVYFNPANELTTTVPRHREIKKFLCKKICQDLKIPIL